MMYYNKVNHYKDFLLAARGSKLAALDEILFLSIAPPFMAGIRVEYAKWALAQCDSYRFNCV